jgi:hypothetical protein
MAAMGRKSDIAKIIKRARAQGFLVRESKEYWIVFGPNDRPGGEPPCTIGHTPSSSRSLKNFMNCLKRKGYRP